IGGQAVLEGVMMRGSSVTATAVRDPNGKIQVESSRSTPIKDKPYIYRMPIVRGMIALFSSLITGTGTLMRASEVYGDFADEDPSKFEKWLAKTFKLDIMDVITWVGVLLGVCLSVFLFVFLPNLVTDLIYSVVNIESLNSTLSTIIKNLTSGAIRISIFVGYIWITSFVKDIKRLYGYHGAEHKVISCYEKGLPLTVENAQKQTTVHDRCGTTFMFIVMIFSIIFFSFFGWQELWLRFLIRLACIPLVAGISYELLKLFAKYDNWFVKMCKAPGLMLQKLTTKEPDDSMIEVSIKAFQTVLTMEEDSEIACTKFNVAVTVEKAKSELMSIDKKRDYSAEIAEVLMVKMGLKNRSALADTKERVMSADLDDAKEQIKAYLAGTPLQYAVGSTCFYGYEIKVDKRVLIPRPDSEHLVSCALSAIKGKSDAKVLELCVGSGAVSIAIAKEGNCSVEAVDISPDAIAVATENVATHGADVRVIESDMFGAVTDKYDVIVSNPPYIPTADILELDGSVKDYEPMLALDGGTDGLDFYRRIANEYDSYLNEGGQLILEVGINQMAAVSALFSGKKEIIKDYNNPPIERVLVVTK
ncbi:MAG: peptide chain release factor N(5)-glutamine methyltransferase, partial [Bacillota bacterium]